jgi:hypothetical protein
MRMFRLPCLLLFLGTALFAQDAADLFHKPPADLDQALRARVAEFFDLHVKGEYRRAEGLVAEDTKEFFYDRNKPRYLGFELKTIKYNEDFTKAQVMVLCEQVVPFMEFSGKPVKVMTPSTWKLENGKWCWYVDQEALHMTPFGRMWNNTPAASGDKTPPPTPFQTAGAIPTVAQFYAMFKVDKEAVTLSPGGSEQIVITNGSPGPMGVQLVGTVPGIEAKIDESQVKPGGKTTLTLHAGPDAKSGTLQLRFEPVAKVTPITVTVK